MGKTKQKKPFIDKKNSSTYHLLYRSQRDVGGEEGSTTVLWPDSNNNVETNAKVLLGQTNMNRSSQDNNYHQHNSWDQWKNKIQQVGLVDDYDYEKHLKPITGTGDFFASNGHRGNPMNDVRALPKMFYEDTNINSDVNEVDRQLDAIVLTADCMDDDIAQALFGEFDETDFEELQDDFCIAAAQEPAEDDEVVEFDYDAHIKQLLEKANLKGGEGSCNDAVSHDWGRKDQDFFSKAKPLHECREEGDDESGHYDSYDNEDEQHVESPGVVPALNPDEERALCEKFQQTLAEYDSDEVGGLDDECDYIGGDRSLEGDARVEEMLDEYLIDKDADFYMEGTRHLPQFQRKAGFRVLQGRVDDPEPIDKVLAEAQDFLRTPEMTLPPEEILIDGKSYFSQSSRNPWDCESVLSTYSNLDNNPSTIERGRRRGKKKTTVATVEPVMEDVGEAQPVQIRLSNKTGLPLGVLPSREKGDDFDFDTIQSVNKGEKRIPGESADEKKLRKQLVKHERLVSRIQKKLMKDAFQDAFLKAEVASGDDLAGKSVFRF